MPNGSGCPPGISMRGVNTTLPAGIASDAPAPATPGTVEAASRTRSNSATRAVPWRSALAPQRLERLGAGRVPAWSDAEEKCCNRADSGGEAEHAPIKGEIQKY